MVPGGLTYTVARYVASMPQKYSVIASVSGTFMKSTPSLALRPSLTAPACSRNWFPIFKWFACALTVLSALPFAIIGSMGSSDAAAAGALDLPPMMSWIELRLSGTGGFASHFSSPQLCWLRTRSDGAIQEISRIP